MTTAPATKIEPIVGKNPILLIAPHGVMGDDDNTDELTRKMAVRLNCYAVINDVYKRPDDVIDPITKENSKGPADPANNRYDLNNLDHLLKHKVLTKDFLEPIINFKNEIKAKAIDIKPLVILVHGIDDENVEYIYDKDTAIVMGIGLPDRLTYDGKSVKKLKNLLAQATLKPIKAVCSNDTPFVDDGENYAGRDKKKLNQLFAIKKSKRYDPAVQSIQLEIKKVGFRDTPENIESTAERLSLALADLAGFELAKVEENLPATITDSAPVPKVELALPDHETQPNLPLVENAYNKLAGIFKRRAIMALLEAGQYIIDTFYDGKIALAKAASPAKEKSLNQLIAKIQEKTPGSPSRSWIYNAVDMVINEVEFKDVQTYGQLKSSHKIILLPVKDPNQKTLLIEETIAKNYSARQLKNRRAELIPQEPPKPITLGSAIANPELLFSKECSQLIDDKNLGILKAKTKATIRTKAKAQRAILEKEIEDRRKYIEGYDKLITDLGKDGKAEKVDL